MQHEHMAKTSRNIDKYGTLLFCATLDVGCLQLQVPNRANDVVFTKYLHEFLNTLNIEIVALRTPSLIVKEKMNPSSCVVVGTVATPAFILYNLSSLHSFHAPSPRFRQDLRLHRRKSSAQATNKATALGALPMQRA